MSSAEDKAFNIFRAYRGTLRTVEALREGIHPRTLYSMRDNGKIEMLARGLYRLANLPLPTDVDLLVVAKKVPQAVVCLITALAFHRLTTQVAHSVEIALPASARLPRLDHPPVTVYRFSPATLSAGVECHSVDGVPIRVFSKEKTLADIFKYRNKVGVDVAVEALRTYRSQSRANYGEVLKYARLCRVENVIRPYIEAIV